MKPIKLAPILARLKIRERKQCKAKRMTRKTLFWLKYQHKKASERAATAEARVISAEYRHWAYKKTIVKQNEDIKALVLEKEKLQ